MTIATRNEKYINRLASWIKAAKKEVHGIDTTGFIHDLKPIYDGLLQTDLTNVELDDILPIATNEKAEEIAHRLGLFITECKLGTMIIHDLKSPHELGGTGFSQHHRYIKDEYAETLTKTTKFLLTKQINK